MNVYMVHIYISVMYKIHNNKKKRKLICENRQQKH